MREDTAASAALVLARCAALAAFSEEPDRLTRTFLCPAMHSVHAAMRGWMEEAGLTVQIDAAGNIRGRRPAAGSSTAGTLLLGSHLDTVPDAGRYDGVLGVVLALAAVAALGERPLSFAIEVIGFSEEEGVRFGTPYLGSLARIGQLTPELLSRTDANGVSVTQAIRDFGMDPKSLADAHDPDEAFIGYLEAHIEQGPVLESLHQPLGVVTAIAGQSRCRVTLHGRAGHAGTTPMAGRRDALTGAAEVILAAEQLAADFSGLVATVGRLDVLPNASNVIPGAVDLSVDIRHAVDTQRVAAVRQMQTSVSAIAERRGLGSVWETVSAQDAVPMDPALSKMLAQAAEAAGLPAPMLASGAGHDAAILARRVPSAMLFLRSPGGVSHSPAETVREDDVAAALHTLTAFLEMMADEPTWNLAQRNRP